MNKEDEKLADAILEDLKEKGKRMTAEDIRKQKIGFIWGMLPHTNKMTEEEIADKLDRLEGRKPGV